MYDEFVGGTMSDIGKEFCGSCRLLVKGVNFKHDPKGEKYYSRSKFVKRVVERKKLNNGKEVIATYYKKKKLDMIDNRPIKYSKCSF